MSSVEKNAQPWGRLRIHQGMVYVYYAFDIGQSIQLDVADQRITALKERTTRIKSKKRVSQFFEFSPAPIRVTQSCPELDVGPGFRTRNTLDLLMFDFGAVSVRFQIPLSGDFENAVRLSDALYSNSYLRDQARSQIELLIKEIAPAVSQLHVSSRVEDYSIFQIESFEKPLLVEDFWKKYPEAIAALLSSEFVNFPEEFVQERIQARISYSSEDVTFVDWNTALVYDDDADEICSVLEFTNIALLEYSLLDNQLDRALDEFYLFFQQPRGKYRSKLQSITQFLIDSAMLFEGVSNALKLLGDEYLARLYRLSSKRLGLSNWDASITRKIGSLESIYEKISNEEAHQKMQRLEVIIIILIAVSIFVPFIPGLAKLMTK